MEDLQSTPRNGIIEPLKKQLSPAEKPREKLSSRKLSAPQDKQNQENANLKSVQSPSSNKTRVANIVTEKKNPNSELLKNIQNQSRRNDMKNADISSLKGQNDNTGLSGEDLRDFQNIIETGKFCTEEDLKQARKNQNKTSKKQKNLIDQVKEKQEEIMQQINNFENYLDFSDNTKKKRNGKSKSLFDGNQMKSPHHPANFKLRDSQTQTDDNPFVTPGDLRFATRRNPQETTKNTEENKNSNDKGNNNNLKKTQSADKISKEHSSKEMGTVKNRKELEKVDLMNPHKSKKGLFEAGEPTSSSKYQTPKKDDHKNTPNRERKSPSQEIGNTDQQQQQEIHVNNKNSKTKTRESEIPSFSKYQSKR